MKLNLFFSSPQTVGDDFAGGDVDSDGGGARKSLLLRLFKQRQQQTKTKRTKVRGNEIGNASPGSRDRTRLVIGRPGACK